MKSANICSLILHELRRLHLLNVLAIGIAGIIIAITWELCYGAETEFILLFEAKDIAGWKSSIAAGEAELTDDGFALVSGKGGWGGGVASPWLSINFAKSPVITIKVHEVSNNWVLKLGLYHNDDQWGPYIQGDNNQTGEFSYDLPGALHSFPDGVNPPDPEATEEVQIRVWGSDAPDAKVWVESITMSYKDDPEDRPRFADPELEKAYSARFSPVEAHGKVSSLWGFIKKN